MRPSTVSESESWTIGRLLEWTTEFLQRRGSDSPRLDAEVLLSEALNCRRIELYTAFAEIVAERPRAVFRDLVRRRSEGAPVAYLVGRREFYSLSFRVTPDVLIPRPETEFLIVALLDWAGGGKNKSGSAVGAGGEQGGSARREESCPPRICDVGTGSGAIAVTAAVHLPQARVTAVDICPKALEVARDNARRHGVDDRMEFFQSDLFEAVPDDRRFDFILSNPPYVSESEMAALARDVRDHEPRGALLAGPRGTEVIERLLPAAVDRLLPGGRLLIEVSPTIHDAAAALVTATAGLRPGETVKDLARRPRVVQAQKC